MTKQIGCMRKFVTRAKPVANKKAGYQRRICYQGKSENQKEKVTREKRISTLMFEIRELKEKKTQDNNIAVWKMTDWYSSFLNINIKLAPMQ